MFNYVYNIGEYNFELLANSKYLLSILERHSKKNIYNSLYVTNIGQIDRHVINILYNNVNIAPNNYISGSINSKFYAGVCSAIESNILKDIVYKATGEYILSGNNLNLLKNYTFIDGIAISVNGKGILLIGEKNYIDLIADIAVIYENGYFISGDTVIIYNENSNVYIDGIFRSHNIDFNIYKYLKSGYYCNEDENNMTKIIFNEERCNNNAILDKIIYIIDDMSYPTYYCKKIDNTKNFIKRFIKYNSKFNAEFINNIDIYIMNLYDIYSYDIIKNSENYHKIFKELEVTYL